MVIYVSNLLLLIHAMVQAHAVTLVDVLLTTLAKPMHAKEKEPILFNRVLEGTFACKRTTKLTNKKIADNQLP